jgi:RNA polymerase sigma-70 factor, ECF subfamily
LQEVLPGVCHEQPEARASEQQLQADFRRALQSLPAEQRETFVLYEESGLGLEEIGDITGVAMETAKSRLRYAVSKLRAALRQHQPLRAVSGVQS